MSIMNQSRSSNYPADSLKDVVPRVELIYRKQSRRTSEREDIALTLGYSGLNGAAKRKISSSLKYGLLETIGGELRVSNRAIEIIEFPKGHPERLAAVRAAAFAPALFSELRDHYGNRLPSDENIKMHLIRKGFSPQAASDAIQAYKGTLAFLDTEASASQSGVSSGQVFQPDAQAEPSSNLLEHPQPISGWAVQTALPTQPLSVAIPPTPDSNAPASDNELVLRFKVAENCVAHITFKGAATREAVEKLIKHLELSLDVFPSQASIYEER